MQTIVKSNKLAHALRDFFEDHLPRLRGMSQNTIHSYRDCLVLLLQYVAEQKRYPVTKLEIGDINAKQILKFLQMLEDKRENKSTTRNTRLSAIHAFFSYIAYKCPEEVEGCQKILAIPFKRSDLTPIFWTFPYEHNTVLAGRHLNKELF